MDTKRTVVDPMSACSLIASMPAVRYHTTSEPSNVLACYRFPACAAGCRTCRAGRLETISFDYRSGGGIGARSAFRGRRHEREKAVLELATLCPCMR